MSKYQRWHDQIIDRARHRTLDPYKERHHIRPRSLGGSDDPDNLVDLTYREHFLVHWLLIRLLSGYERRLMLYALHCMALDHVGGRIVGGWRVEVAKRALKSEALRRAAERAERRKQFLREERAHRTAAANQVIEATKGAMIRRGMDRKALSKMAGVLIKADPKRLSRFGDIAERRRRLAKKRRQERSLLGF